MHQANLDAANIECFTVQGQGIVYPCHSLISGTGNTSTDGSYKPSFLTDQELKHLILEVRTARF